MVRSRHRAKGSVAKQRTETRYLVPDEDCARTGIWVYVTEDDPRCVRAKQSGHFDPAVSREFPIRASDRH